LDKLARKIQSRSPSEIRFRVRQELTNLSLFAFPPTLPSKTVAPSPIPSSLPDPADVANQLKSTPFAVECINIAKEILAHRFPLLGVTLSTGPEIAWRRDYGAGVETGTAYFRRIPYLDAAQAGDHKIIWELNRHQHLVLLAQAHLISGRRDFLDEITRQLESWFEQNPFQRGINWCSALEVAFRTLSWIWVHRIVGDRFDDALRRRFLEALYRHGLHLEANLSYYFSPNTHLLGEGVALHALGALFPHFPGADRMRQTGANVVRREMDRQVCEDGSHFEQSIYYHVYALDMFLFHAILQKPDDAFRHKLRRMTDFLSALMGPSGVLPFLGDDDGGRFFHPYGARKEFGRATLASCGVFFNRAEWIRNRLDLAPQAVWWIDGVEHVPVERSTSQSIRFADSGLVVMAKDHVQIIVDAGPFGSGSAGHSHADTLSLLLRQGAEQILTDPGAYTYVSDRVWRHRFRGTAMHNTVRIDGSDQAVPSGPFAWSSKPEVELIRWETCAEWDLLIATCSYVGLRHQRDVVFSKADALIVIVDRVYGGLGEHLIEQFWHFGEAVRQLSTHCFQVGTAAVAAFELHGATRLSEGGEYGWISPAPGAKTAAPVLCVERRSGLPISLAALIDLSGKSKSLRVRLHADGHGVDGIYDDNSLLSLAWAGEEVQRTEGRDQN